MGIQYFPVRKAWLLENCPQTEEGRGRPDTQKSHLLYLRADVEGATRRCSGKYILPLALQALFQSVFGFFGLVSLSSIFKKYLLIYLVVLALSCGIQDLYLWDLIP